ncbi:MAG: alpha/beta hydrolase [Rhodospirillales bacterium]|nr:alpha/beta hydrolase [Rhodospirillales bacterium]
MNITKVNGIELAWDCFGAVDAQAILLIAGLGTQMIRWSRPFCEGLAASGHRVIRFDNRDAGCSTHLTAMGAPDFGALASVLMAGGRPEVPYTLHQMAEDAIGLLDAIGVARAHVVGRSMGGMIAQVMASDHADRVISLTSMMSSTGNPALPQAAPDVLAMMMRPAPDPIEDLEGYLTVRLGFARRIAGRRHPFDETAHRAVLLDEVRRGHDPSGVARQLAAMSVAGDRRARLATVKVPTLVIHGTDDPLILPACGEDTARAIPDAVYLPIEGMGHDLPREYEQTVIEAICSLTGLRSHPTGA